MKTKNLYLCQVKNITNIDSKYLEFLTVETTTYVDDDSRYILARLSKYEDGTKGCFKDAFTGTRFLRLGDSNLRKGDSCVIATRPIVTNKKYLKNKDALEILKYLNPTCIVEKGKILTLGRKKEN